MVAPGLLPHVGIKHSTSSLLPLSHHNRATGVRDGVRTAGLHVENVYQETIPLHCFVT